MYTYNRDCRDPKVVDLEVASVQAEYEVMIAENIM